MKVFKLYNIQEDVRQLFNTDRLLSVATLVKSGNSYMMDTNQFPGASLLNGASVKASGQGYQIIRNGAVIGFIETAGGAGCVWRHYNHADKSRATMIRLLVYGDPTYDMICANTAFEVSDEVNGIVMVKNVTEVNGEPWQTVQMNRIIKKKGFHIAVSSVSDGTFGSLRYIAANALYNQNGTSRREYVKLTKRTDLPISTDVTSVSQMNDNSVDYVYLSKDIADADVECLGIQFVFDTKNESEVLRIPLSQIFPQPTPSI